MADLTDIVNALMGQETQAAIAAENPYYQFKVVPETIVKSAYQYQPRDRGELWSQAAAASLGGLLGAGLGAFGGQYQDELSDRYNKAMGAVLQDQTPDMANLPTGLFRRAQQQQRLFQLQDLMDRKKMAQDVLKAGLLEQAKVIGQEAGWGTTEGGGKGGSGGNPNNPYVKQRKELETETYNRITKLPTYSEYSDISSNFNTLISLAGEDSRPASVGMISALARIWDPKGTVREGEYAINSQAQSALDSIYGDWRQLVLGKGKLSAGAKKQIIQAAARKYNEFGKKYEGERAQLLEALSAQGGNPSNIPTAAHSPFLDEQLDTLKVVDTGDMEAKKRSWIQKRAAELRAQGKK